MQKLLCSPLISINLCLFRSVQDIKCFMSIVLCYKVSALLSLNKLTTVSSCISCSTCEVRPIFKILFNKKVHEKFLLNNSTNSTRNVREMWNGNSSVVEIWHDAGYLVPSPVSHKIECHGKIQHIQQRKNKHFTVISTYKWRKVKLRFPHQSEY